MNTLENVSLLDIFLSTNNVVEPHYHQNAAQLVYCISGAATVSMLNPYTKQIQSYSITPGQVANVPQGWWHYEVASLDSTHLLAIFDAPTPQVILCSDILKFDHSASRIVYEEYMHQLTGIQQRLNRLEEEIEQQAIIGVHVPMIQALQTLRGVAVVTAASLVAEVGSFQRFSSPKQFMAYVGLIPSESSSGELRLYFIEYEIIRFNGSTFFAESMGIPTFFNNEPAHQIIIRDITERKRTQELLLNSEKLTIAGQLAAGIAHEVRNPLTAIKGFIQLIDGQSEHQTYFNIIRSEIDRIELILSELLVLSKPLDSKYEKVEFETLMEDVKALMDPQAIMHNIEIEIINNCTDVTISCDKNQLKQVFINFLKNAIEAMSFNWRIFFFCTSFGVLSAKEQFEKQLFLYAEVGRFGVAPFHTPFRLVALALISSSTYLVEQ